MRAGVVAICGKACRRFTALRFWGAGPGGTADTTCPDSWQLCWQRERQCLVVDSAREVAQGGGAPAIKVQTTLVARILLGSGGVALRKRVPSEGDSPEKYPRKGSFTPTLRRRRSPRR
jgi:hypothetical protein